MLMAEEIKIGEIRTSKKGFEYEVTEKLQKGKWKVRFLETGYEAISDSKEVRNGGIRDWLAPYVCGKGVVGTEISHPQSHYLYDRWRDMLRRCYDKNCKAYKTYGAKGCYVDDRWYHFNNYVTDIENKENSEYLKDKNLKWEIDKDILFSNNKIYSNETVVIVNKEKNLSEMFNRVGYVGDIIKREVMQFNINGEYINTFDSMSDAIKYISNNEKSNTCGIWACCNGSEKTAMGYCWIYKDDFINFENAKEKILNMLKPKKRKAKFIYQKMDELGNILEEFKNLTDVSKTFNIPESTVRSAFKRSNYNYGYYWNKIINTEMEAK